MSGPPRRRDETSRDPEARHGVAGARPSGGGCGGPCRGPPRRMIPDMLDLARRALTNAHAPYSRFRVGACVRTASGKLYAGGNVENASYGLTLCAETTAIGAMVTAGDRDIVEVVLLTERPELLSPCGRCRQQLAEFAEPQARIHLCGPEGIRLTTTLGELLPLRFGPNSLPHPGA